MQINNNLSFYKNIQNVPSFTSTYKVKITKSENCDKQSDMYDVEDMLFRNRDKVSVNCEFPKKYTGDEIAAYTIVSDDYDHDDIVEALLTSKGIKYSKKDFRTLLDSEESIKSRIVLDEDSKRRGFKLVNINTRIFDCKYKSDGFAYIGDMYHISQPERMTRFEEYLKKDKEINASIVSVRNNNGIPEISFCDGRHRYAYMRDLGMRTMPVAMDEDSIRVARKFELLAD